MIKVKAYGKEIETDKISDDALFNDTTVNSMYSYYLHNTDNMNTLEMLYSLVNILSLEKRELESKLKKIAIAKPSEIIITDTGKGIA